MSVLGPTKDITVNGPRYTGPVLQSSCSIPFRAFDMNGLVCRLLIDSCTVTNRKCQSLPKGWPLWTDIPVVFCLHTRTLIWAQYPIYIKLGANLLWYAASLTFIPSSLTCRLTSILHGYSFLATPDFPFPPSTPPAAQVVQRFNTTSPPTDPCAISLYMVRSTKRGRKTPIIISGRRTQDVEGSKSYDPIQSRETR